MPHIVFRNVAPLASFTVFINDAKAIEYAVKDAYEFLNLKELENSLEPVNICRHDIELKNVFFSYNTDKDDNLNRTNNYVLNNINLKLPEGKFCSSGWPFRRWKIYSCKINYTILGCEQR